jgi:hypothetical protein
VVGDDLDAADFNTICRTNDPESADPVAVGFDDVGGAVFDPALHLTSSTVAGRTLVAGIKR